MKSSISLSLITGVIAVLTLIIDDSLYLSCAGLVTAMTGFICNSIEDISKPEKGKE